jgi:hypothetical protein
MRNRCRLGYRTAQMKRLLETGSRLAGAHGIIGSFSVDSKEAFQENEVYYLLADRLGSTSLDTYQDGQPVPGSRTEYYPHNRVR